MKVILRIFKLSKETVADLLDFRTRRYSATFSFFVKTERGGFTRVDYFAGFILNPNKVRPTNVYDIIGRGGLIIKEGNLMNPCIETYYEQDFKSEEDAVEMFEKTHADGIMIGRAALGNPWIFKKIIYFLEPFIN